MIQKTFTLTLAQLNFTVGDFEGNRQKMLAARATAVEQGADLIAFPELSITGYPPEDLVYRPAFRKASQQSLHQLAAATEDGKTSMLVGGIGEENGNIFNSVFLLDGGKIIHTQHKHDLPNYGVFDEKRVFSAGALPQPFNFHDIRLGLMICEDMWNMKVTECLNDADLILSVNGSPFEITKHEKRMERALANINRLHKPLAYVNMLAGQDDLVFDGDSFVLSAEGKLLHNLSRTAEELRTIQWRSTAQGWVCDAGSIASYEGWQCVTYQAMMLGLRDYIAKNRFPGVLIGMSGGIDSALSAAIAVDALGAENVWLVMMPSRYTSAVSVIDAEDCAKALGARLDTIPIEDMFRAYEDTLAPTFSGKNPDITEENLQSRIRGTVLMALSNKFGHMVLSTGNKSEMAVGYATLYGDMCGGYNVLKDAYKTQVNALAAWRNEHAPEGGTHPALNILPQNILLKPPTAELRPDQTDEASLAPYPVLDAILMRLIEEEMTIEEIVSAGFEEALVRRIRRLVYLAEYKRRQSAPGVKISAKPFSRDRRYPITNSFGS